MKKKLFSVLAVLTIIVSLSSCGTYGQYAQNGYGHPYGYQPGQVIIGRPAQHPYGSTTIHLSPAQIVGAANATAAGGLSNGSCVY